MWRINNSKQRNFIWSRACFLTNQLYGSLKMALTMRIDEEKNVCLLHHYLRSGVLVSYLSYVYVCASVYVRRREANANTKLRKCEQHPGINCKNEETVRICIVVLYMRTQTYIHI